jgi:hypothetical protein
LPQPPGPGLGRQIPCPRTREPARSAVRSRLRSDEPSEASALGAGTRGSLLIRTLVRWVPESTGLRSVSVTGAAAANMASSRWLAKAWIDRNPRGASRRAKGVIR